MLNKKIRIEIEVNNDHFEIVINKERSSVTTWDKLIEIIADALEKNNDNSS